MSLYLCSLTGEVPSKPVVNTKDARVYEEKNIKKYMNFSTVDPFDQSRSVTEADLEEIPSKDSNLNLNGVFTEFIERLKSYNQFQNSSETDIFNKVQRHLKSFNIGTLD